MGGGCLPFYMGSVLLRRPNREWTPSPRNARGGARYLTFSKPSAGGCPNEGHPTPAHLTPRIDPLQRPFWCFGTLSEGVLRTLFRGLQHPIFEKFAFLRFSGGSATRFAPLEGFKKMTLSPAGCRSLQRAFHVPPLPPAPLLRPAHGAS